MTDTTAARTPTDKRGAILSAAERLIARLGLHNAPMSALAREAGVAAGTLYLYFPSKEALINALYLDALGARTRAMLADVEAAPDVTGRAALWAAWHALAHWHLEHVEASSVILQCQASGILTAETRDAEQRLSAGGFARFEQAIAHGDLRPLSPQLFWALFAGPIFLLAQMRDARELDVTDAVLRETFDGVCRSVQRAAACGDA